MASSNSKSISGGCSIPFNKNADDIFNDMTAFTPPADSWIVQYKSQQKKDTLKSKEKSRPFVPAAHQLEQSCKNYIESSEVIVKSDKSLGTDDHFKSMVCSKNLLKVCEKLMTNKESSKQSNSLTSEKEDEFDAELSLMDEKKRMEFYRNKYGNRRDSQSLPSSPKFDRKNKSDLVSYNPYFTISKAPDSKPDGSISFLTNLFGITAKKPELLKQNVSTLEPKSSSDQSKAIDPTFSNGNGNESISQVGSSKRKLTPQPHQYREMNFWSPTSM